MLQLCCCIEAHLKENTAYFQVRPRPTVAQLQHSEDTSGPCSAHVWP